MLSSSFLKVSLPEAQRVLQHRFSLYFFQEGGLSATGLQRQMQGKGNLLVCFGTFSISNRLLLHSLEKFP
jgi:hypothetical protein